MVSVAALVVGKVSVALDIVMVSVKTPSDVWLHLDVTVILAWTFTVALKDTANTDLLLPAKITLDSVRVLFANNWTV